MKTKLYHENTGAYDDEDVPNVVDPKPYTTHIAIEDNELSNDELPDNSIIVPKKVDTDKKLLIENPPKSKNISDCVDNKMSETDITENIRRPRPIPDILGSMAAYLLQRKANKSGAEIILNSEIGRKKVATLKAIMKSKIKSDPQNGLHDFMKSFLEKLSEGSRIAFYNLLEKALGGVPTDDDKYKEIFGKETSGKEAGVDPTTDMAPSDTDPNQLASGGVDGIPGQMDSVGSSDTPTYASGDNSVGEIGRIYELKRIFARLTTLDKYLSYSTDDKILELKERTNTALEMFKLIISNVDKFLDKIDDIIVLYYDFLMAIYKILKAYLEVVSEKK